MIGCEEEKKLFLWIDEISQHLGLAYWSSKPNAVTLHDCLHNPGAWWGSARGLENHFLKKHKFFQRLPFMILSGKELEFFGIFDVKIFRSFFPLGRGGQRLWNALNNSEKYQEQSQLWIHYQTQSHLCLHIRSLIEVWKQQLNRISSKCSRNRTFRIFLTQPKWVERL